MKTVTIQEAEAHLAELIAEAAAGEDVVIERDGVAVARIEAVAPVTRPERTPGGMKGLFIWKDSFFDPLPDDELDRWEGSESFWPSSSTPTS